MLPSLIVQFSSSLFDRSDSTLQSFFIFFHSLGSNRGRGAESKRKPSQLQPHAHAQLKE